MNLVVYVFKNPVNIYFYAHCITKTLFIICIYRITSLSELSSLIQKHYMLFYRCICFNCEVQPSIDECVCCNEISQIAAKKGEHLCIIGHPGFQTVCLDVWVLQTAYFSYRQQHGDHIDQHINERYRYTAYRQLVRWCWGYFSKEVRVPLPSCAVNRIQQEFPSIDHIGFGPEKNWPSLE